MKLWILYSKKHETTAVYSTELMMNAASKFGIEHELFYFNYFRLVIINNKETLFYKNQQVTQLPDVVFCRGYYIELIKYLEKNGVKIINSAFGMQSVKNKYETHVQLTKINVSQPKTMFANFAAYQDIVNMLGSPFVMKDNLGSKGNNVYLVKSEQEFNEIKTEHETTRIDFIYQEYIASSKGRDIRVYVVGDTVVGAIKRVSENEADFRANLSQGGSAHVFELSEELKKLSIEICKTLKLEIAGLDFLFDENNQPIFCEANGNAAFSGFVKFGYKMQEIFMQYIAKTYSKF